MTRFLFVLCFAILLSACAITPNTLGVSQQQWNKMNQAKQNQLLDGYYRVQTEQQKARSEPADSSNPVLKVTVKGGEIMMPSFEKYHSYQPVNFSVQGGTCTSVDVSQTDGMQSIQLDACYYDQVLYLDPSRFDLAKQPGSVRLVYSPIWQRGFTYHNISTTGYARLRKVDVTVRQFDAHDAY